MKMRNAGLLLAAFAWLAIPAAVTSANAQPNDNGRVLVASNVVKLESLALVSGSGFVGSIPKRFLLPFNGVVRVKWKVRSGTAGKSAFVSIVSQLGPCDIGITNQITTSTAFVNGKCDIRVVQGDIVTVSVNGTAGFHNSITTIFTPDSAGFMKDVTVSFNVQNGTGLGKVLP